MKKLRFSVLFICLALMCGICAAGKESGEIYAPPQAFSSYTYDYWNNPVECPDPYVVVKTLTGVDLGIGDMKKPNDIFADDSGFLYIAVSGDKPEDNRLIKLDGQLNVIKAWQGYTDSKGAAIPFSDPQGVFVKADGDIYLADGLSKNIYHMDKNCVIKRIIGAPVSENSSIIDEKFTERYRPSKLVVDASERIHVVAGNVNEGIVEFDPDGQFEGFLAAGKVNASAIEILWKKLSTQEQLERSTDFVPIEYNNISLDREDFVFASMASIDSSVVMREIRSRTGSEQGALVRRLNMLGQDILRRKGFGPPVGDLAVDETVDNMDAGYAGISHIADVACGENGCYTVIDDNRCRIFTYDSEGCLLYAFGGPDQTAGGFRSPNSIAQSEEYLYVLDNSTHAVTMLARTYFGNTVAEAIAAQENGEYARSMECWQKVLELDGNYDWAYSGIGKALYQNGEYREAMKMFKLGNNRTWYSRAFKEYSNAQIARYFAPVCAVLAAVLILIAVLRFILKKWIPKYKRRKG